jgi:flagellar hook-basal body complex protein FliE
LLQQVRSSDATTTASTSDAPAGSFTDALKTALDTVNRTDAKADAVTEAYEKGEVTDVAQVMLARQDRASLSKRRCKSATNCCPPIRTS